MGFILCFNKNYLFQENDHQMLLASIIQSLLIENYTNCIAKSIHLNINMIL